MIKKTIKLIVVIICLLGLTGLILLYQEYRPSDVNELSIERVRQKNLIGDFIYPSTKNNLPVIVFLGGSSGGLGYEEELKSLALNGYSVFSLAYFKKDGLPDKLENIPLEYFENAFDWLSTKSQADTSKLLLLGVSRGAELALLLGSYYPQVKGVIAYSPKLFCVTKRN
jgi:dienelactone hydrolase